MGIFRGGGLIKSLIGGGTGFSYCFTHLVDIQVSFHFQHVDKQLAIYLLLGHYEGQGRVENALKSSLLGEEVVYNLRHRFLNSLKELELDCLKETLIRR